MGGSSFGGKARRGGRRESTSKASGGRRESVAESEDVGWSSEEENEVRPEFERYRLGAS